MKHLIRLTDYNPAEIKEIFEIADALQNNKYTNILKGKTVLCFSPIQA